MDSPHRALELIELDVAARLRSVCAHMSEEEFRELVHDIARVKLKYDPDPLPEQLPGSTTDSILMAQPEPEQDPPEEESGA